MGEAARALVGVVQHLVDNPGVVRARELTRGRVRVLELEVAAEDMGSVIGRGGRTASALRVLLRARGEALGVTYELKIREQGVE